MSLLANIARVEGLLRSTYVRIHNLRLLDRFVLSYFRLVVSGARTIAGGYWNAEVLSRPGLTVGAALMVHRATGGRDDLSRFLVRLAKLVVASRPRAPATLDLVIVADDTSDVSAYTAVARLFRGRVSLHVVWSLHDAEKLLRTLGPVELIDEHCTLLTAQSDKTPERVQEESIGRVRPRQVHANIAREFLKSIDWSARFCALSIPVDFPEPAVLAALAEIESGHPGWRLMLLGGRASGKALRLQRGRVVPSHSGLDFSTQLALAMEADAYLGPADVFGMAALLGGRPVTILGDKKMDRAVAIDAMPSVRMVSQSSPESLEYEINLLMKRLSIVG